MPFAFSSASKSILQGLGGCPKIWRVLVQKANIAITSSQVAIPIRFAARRLNLNTASCPRSCMFNAKSLDWRCCLNQIRHASCFNGQFKALLSFFSVLKPSFGLTSSVHACTTNLESEHVLQPYCRQCNTQSYGASWTHPL